MANDYDSPDYDVRARLSQMTYQQQTASAKAYFLARQKAMNKSEEDAEKSTDRDKQLILLTEVE